MYGLAKRSVYSSMSCARLRFRVVGGLEVLAEDEVHRAGRAHHRDLGRRPREREVGADRLRVHDHVRAAVGLARDDLHPRHGCLAVRVEQLRAVADDAAVLLVGAGQEAGDVDERDERDVERVARAHEPGGLLRRVDVERAREHLRLVPDDADDVAVDPREPAHDVHRPERVHLEELAVVDDLGDHLLHVVRLVRRVRDELDDPVARAVGIVVGLEVRRVLEVVGRQEREQVAHLRRARPARRRTRTRRRRTSTRASARRRAVPA